MSLSGNRPELYPPKFWTLRDYLWKAYKSHPNRVAVSHLGRNLTYLQLYQQARALAFHLSSLGVVPGDRIAIYIDRSHAAFTAIYASILTGACYVPIDVQTPRIRLRTILKDCQPKILITRTMGSLRGIQRIIPPSTRHLLIRSKIAPKQRRALVPPKNKISPEHTAYILYTSGSTGRPKGIQLTHRNSVAFIEWAHKTFNICKQDRIANISPFQFDISVFDIFNTCRAGASVHPIPYPKNLFPSSTAQFLIKNRITVFYTVPSVFSGIHEGAEVKAGAFPHLRIVLFAGEVMDPKVLAAWLAYAPNARFYNLYGPTETNVCLFYPISRNRKYKNGIPIGRPIAKTELRILARNRQPLPVGSKGELCVKGPTVMKGYLNEKNKPANTFLFASPLGKNRSGIFYKTGDIVSKERDRNYYFWGRRDDQVKIRGFRVELKEIEAAFLTHPEISQAAVLVKRNQRGRNAITSYLKRHAGARLNETKVLHHVSSRIPPYMLPESIHFVKKIPRLSNGKTDRRALIKR